MISILAICLLIFVIFYHKKEIDRIKAQHKVDVDSERKAAIKQSKAVIKGQVNEHIIPLFEDFPYKASEMRFSGAPTDYIVYRNMDVVREGSTEAKIEIIFADVKTGSSHLSNVQRAVKNALDEGRVRWETWTINDNKLKIK